MSDFFDTLDEYLGDSTDSTDIRITIRRCWFYDFDGYPVRLWQGQGKLFTTDDNAWLGTIDESGRDIHSVPSLTDARDGSSPSYNFTLFIPDMPGEPAGKTYEALKSEQWRTAGRSLTCYFAIFNRDEGLRPQTPLLFHKELQMKNVKFSETVNVDSSGVMTKYYSATVIAKDGNFGRSNVPGGTYADTTQKQRAKELGVPLDRGAEFLVRLANRTYQLP